VTLQVILTDKAPMKFRTVELQYCV